MLVGAFSKLTLQNGLTNQNVSLNNAFFPQLHRKVTNLFLHLHRISPNNYYLQQKNNE